VSKRKDPGRTLVDFWRDELPALRDAADRSPLSTTAHGLMVELEEQAKRGDAPKIRAKLASAQVEILWAIVPAGWSLPAHDGPPLHDRLLGAYVRLNPVKRKRGRPRKVLS
jgi:hypothetical protein